MPAGATARIASAVAPGWPEHSRSTSTASPDSLTGVASTSRASVAPSSRASVSRCGFTSVTTTEAAPRASAACIATSPTGPAPVTSTRDPAWTPPLRQAQSPTDSGSSRAAASSVIRSGTGCANCSCTVTSSANAPSIGGVA